MPFEAHLLAIDKELGREFEAALGDTRRLALAVDSPAALVAAARGAALVRAVVCVDDAARLDPAWWIEARAGAGRAQLLVAARHCDEESWRRWTLLGGLGPVRPPFGTLDLEVVFAGEPSLSALFRRSAVLPRHGKALFRYTIPSDPQHIPGLVHAVSLFAMEFGFDLADWATNIPLALDEAVSNAIKHGNRGDARKSVEVEGQVDGAMLRLKVRDEGDGFARDTGHDPVDPAQLLASSGRGLFLIEALMDEVRWLQDGRCVEMIKRVPKPAGK